VNERRRVYVRQHAPGGPAQYSPRPQMPRLFIMIGWATFALAVATLVVLVAAAGAGRFAPHPAGTFRPGNLVATPTTYGAPTCHEDDPCGVTR
jgi:hypothetical protein